MTKDERDAVLKRMRSALKSGRDQRNNYLSDRREDLDVEKRMVWPHMNPDDNLIRLLDESSSRNMLAKVKEHMPDGSEQTFELAEIKGREPYQKRPSVRALRAYNKGNDGPGD